MKERILNMCGEPAIGELMTSCRICPSKSKSVMRNSSERILNMISSAKKKMFFSKGEILTQEEGASQKVYCISKGKLKIYKTDSNGNEVVIGFASNGDIIGGEMLMNNGKYDISAMAVADTVACCIDIELYRNAIQSEKELPLEILKEYENELHQAKEKIKKLARLKVEQKVADALLTLYETFGSGSNNPSIRITLSRQDIANMAGTTKEQVSKVLSEFCESGFINTKGKQIEFLNLDELKNLSNV
jgi:CRP-like cAMP-binding protein